MTRLREARVAKGLNQREVSEASHTPQAIVSALERGVLKPWPKVANRLYPRRWECLLSSYSQKTGKGIVEKVR
jgi:transcriptional regulator with XRE-family HTH domain